MQDLYKELITKIDEPRVILNEPMKKHTTFRVRGTSRYFCKGKNTRRT